MELNNKKLPSLIERAWALHDRLNHEIDDSISFCRYCSDHGRYCDIGQTPFLERKRLIAIRDSLNQVENTLLHLQKLQSWQLKDRQLALSRLEQTRSCLIKQVTQYEGRPLDVVKELSACFGNDHENRTSIDRDVEESVKKNEGESSRRRISGFLICCIRVLFRPWKWQNAVGIAVNLILISASLSSTIKFYHSKQQPYSNSQRKTIVSATYSKEKAAEKLDSLLTISKMPLDVFCGRG
ncbi:hypothetical protein ERO13_D07G144800v2 [Gossypium hirsutum]|uniref:Plastid division protein PDV1 n=6 Tax=Gossypium TaxID=3633 RepID=A0A0D2LZ77_GOSRA|nr:uncharacterized protein LOC105796279 [Gossypium raimondii]XP_016745583.1 uncharacterized protein LOC107954508 [Gossypium hirsutum]KAB2021666.1 hypothetical protein ES319_D07G155800v1 [Gossypium barbadense]TYG61648.1 hypothetical protein ES288_D07G165700v1 [Gossypium darwinii]TYH63055.1 hypothetical protein ES332_D07G163700v1 [Gossypium tomentosum]TYI73874.1 hypothetical protein E1A91_D07G160000v1 [Gossypium mustelinum]KAG4138614.1 hypothetical protein ERO13_D07G144800v2 [Gossypium hirsutum